MKSKIFFILFLLTSSIIISQNYNRFEKQYDGSILDKSTGLIWANSDNQEDVTWYGAKKYCENYKGGGWRMPTMDELYSLYDGNIYGNNGFRITKLITLTGHGWFWTTDRASDPNMVMVLSFRDANKGPAFPNDFSRSRGRVLPVKSNDRFIQQNGGIYDTKTGLTWAESDNSKDVTWVDAIVYCENYKGGGWRMPTMEELLTLYDSSINGANGFHITRNITLSGHGWFWTYDRASDKSKVMVLSFRDANQGPAFTNDFSKSRARVLPVK